MSNCESNIIVIDLTYTDSELSDPTAIDIRYFKLGPKTEIRVGSTMQVGRFTWFSSPRWGPTSRILGCADHETVTEPWDRLVISHGGDDIEVLQRARPLTTCILNSHAYLCDVLDTDSDDDC